MKASITLFEKDGYLTLETIVEFRHPVREIVEITGPISGVAIKTIALEEPMFVAIGPC
jgi:hypothetical protein